MMPGEASPLPGSDGGIAPLSLRVNFSWIFAGNIVYAFSQWCMLVVLARLGTPETVGRFTLALAICAPVFTFTNLELRTIQATDVTREFRFEEYLGVRLLTLGAAFLLILGVTLAMGYRNLVLVVGIVAGAKLCEFSSDLFYGLAQKHQRMDSVGRSLVLRGVLSLGLLTAGMVMTGSLLGGVVGLGMGFAATLVLYDLQWVRRLLVQIQPLGTAAIARIRPAFRAETLKKVVIRALPFAIVMTLNSLNTNIPRYVLEQFSGEGALGIYAALTYFGIVGTKIMQALGRSAIPKLAEYYALGRMRAFFRLTGWLLLVAAVVGVVGVLAAAFFGRFLLNLLYGSEYAAHNDIFVWVMVAGAVGYAGNVLGYVITATRRFRKFVVPFAFPTALALGLSFLLVPRFGLVGAVGVLLGVAIATAVPPVVIWRSIHGRLVPRDLTSDVPEDPGTRASSTENP